MGEVVWINGHIASRENASVSAFDHGFLYGDSVYETVRTSSGRPFLLDRHLQRLRRSAEAIDLQLDRDDADLRDAITETLSAVDNRESAVRIIVTRGVGDIGYDRASCPHPTTMIYARPLGDVRSASSRRGMKAVVVEIRRNDPSSVPPSIKSGNLLNNVIGSLQAQKRGADEGIMLNRNGEVTEGTMTNVFVVRDGQLQTAPVESGLLPGITRGFVMELALEAALPTLEEPYGPDDLRSADEVFVTGTTRGIVPVIAVDDQPIGDGRPGPVTRRLTQLFDETEARLSAPASGSR